MSQSQSLSESHQPRCSLASTYVLNPQSLMLTNTETGQRIPLNQFTSTLPVVTLDAGHGVVGPGSLNGTSYRGVRESTLTRRYAMLTAEALNERGYNVIVTRDSDAIVRVRDPFAFRHQAANKATAGYISIHVNDAPGRVNHRFEIYSDIRLSSSSPSHELGRQIASYQPGDIIHGPSRQYDWKMLNPNFIGRSIPAVLVETGFIRQDFANLTSPSWQQRYTAELARDIDNFHSRRSQTNIAEVCQREEIRIAVRTLMTPFGDTQGQNFSIGDLGTPFVGLRSQLPFQRR